MKLTKKLLKEMVLKEMATFAKAQQKINQGSTFGIFSAYRGERSYAENEAMAKRIQDYLTSHGFSWTTVEGGYKETPKDPETGMPTGEEATSEIEKSYLIFEDDERPDAPKSGKSLFDTINEACKMSDQESFVFGYGVEDPATGQMKAEVAIYKTGAPAPGLENAMQEVWAGPWTTFDKMLADSGYYTKVRSTKGQMAERIKYLQEQVKNTTSTLKKRALRFEIERLYEIQRNR